MNEMEWRECSGFGIDLRWPEIRALGFGLGRFKLLVRWTRAGIFALVGVSSPYEVRWELTLHCSVSIAVSLSSELFPSSWKWVLQDLVNELSE